MDIPDVRAVLVLVLLEAVWQQSRGDFRTLDVSYVPALMPPGVYSAGFRHLLSLNIPLGPPTAGCFRFHTFF